MIKLAGFPECGNKAVDESDSCNIVVETDVEYCVLVVHRCEINHNLDFVAYVVHPYVRIHKLEISAFDHAVRGSDRLLPDVYIVVRRCYDSSVDKFGLRSVYKRPVAPADGGPVYKREMHYVKLVLNAP